MRSHDVEDGVAVNNPRPGHISFFDVADKHVQKAGEGAHIPYGGYAGFNGRDEVLFLLTGMV